MKIYRPMPIDHTLKALERIADEKGLQLEDVPGYVSLCEFLTDVELGDQPSDWHSKERTFEVLNLDWSGSRVSSKVPAFKLLRLRKPDSLRHLQ